ncbi:Catechol 2,3-dioxygenase [Belliella buryatensis]|uniref:Catechol 2,3-dioxygenase n=1 Tax=Belliella buryatensis TaxID=1500549 RepID=A0A239F3F5_9BACT|nr:VOC family protein [Belliella buryatensis]SNS51357.1 Catechol 2,3-dioxygenase [Belliella buryatensis]
MKQRIAQFSLLVKDYDEAIAFYTQKLGFVLLEDTQISEIKRWVRIIPPGNTEENCGILLAKAANTHQEQAVGNQSGGRVFLFLYTDDFERDYQNLLDHKIKIFRDRSDEEFGKVVVFEDLYGNLWDLIEPKQ